MYRFRPTPLLWGIAGASFLLSLPVLLWRNRMEADASGAPAAWPAGTILAVGFLVKAAAAFCRLRWIRGRWRVALGGLTYPLYLLPLEIGGTIIHSLQRHVPAPLLVVTVAAAMVALAWLVHRYVERPVAPLMRRALLWPSATARRRARPLTAPPAADTP